MGISGLHHQLKPAQKRIDVSELRGRTLALDGHALLHRGALSCAEQLAEGEPTTRYAHFAVQRVQMLATKGITKATKGVLGWVVSKIRGRKSGG